MITLQPARAARLFADLDAQQNQRPSKTRPVPLPNCPACALRPDEIVLWADGRRVTISGCGHDFSLTREALLAGLAAQRTI